LLLSSLFAAVGLSAAGRVALPAPGGLDALLYGPLVAACIAVTTILAMGARR
jgi:hypothetical protein